MNHILLVDDSDILRNALKGFIIANTSGYELNFFHAQNGLEALQVIENNKGKICLVITDIMMPKMDGLSLILNIKKSYKELPVVTFSSSSEKFEEVIRCGARYAFNRGDREIVSKFPEVIRPFLRV